MTRALILCCLIACKPSGSKDPATTGTPAGTPTGTASGVPSGSITPELVTVDCQPTDHLQVFRCTAEREVAGPVDFSWAPSAGGLVRTAHSAAQATVHETLVWGLKADTTYAVSAAVPGGVGEAEVAAGSLPPELVDIVSATGSASHDQVLVPIHCATDPAVVMLDPDGDVVWYRIYPLPNLSVGGFHFTEQGTVLVQLGGEFVREHSLDGVEQLALRRGTDFDRPVHHDMYGDAAGRRYMPFAEPISDPAGDYVLDGVYVFDETGILASWHLADHVTIDPTWPNGMGLFWDPVFPGFFDYSHGNAVEVEADGDWTLSFRALDLVMRVAGDIDAPDFGTVRWRLVGDPQSPEVSDFTVLSSNGATADLGYRGQHNANLTSGGQLALFDNRWSVPGDSRMLVMELDEGAGTAEIVEAYDLGVQCDIQGGAYELRSGNRLATCGVADIKTVYEFEPGAADPVWTAEVTCPGWRYTFNRALPVEWDAVLPPGGP